MLKIQYTVQYLCIGYTKYSPFTCCSISFTMGPCLAIITPFIFCHNSYSTCIYSKYRVILSTLLMQNVLLNKKSNHVNIHLFAKS